jgi:exopolysaccharide biosynthesis polyprenyl glycosylphosphotransferase
MKRSEIFLMMLQIPIDICMLSLAIISAYYLRLTDWAVGLKPILFDMTLLQFFSQSLPVVGGMLCLFAAVGLYSPNPNRKLARDLTRVVIAAAIGLALVALYIVFSQVPFDSRFLILSGFIFIVLYVGFGRVSMRGVKGLLYRLGIGLRRVVVIGSGTVAEAIASMLGDRRELGYGIVGQFDHFSGSTKKKLGDLFIDELIFTNPRAHERETLQAIDFCNQRHIVFKYSADLFATYATNMAVSPLAGIPIIEIKRTTLGGWGRVIKRAMDIVFSILMLILISPVALIVSIVILIETGHPVIYKNERVGIRGRHFFTLKFRSMYQKDSTGSQFGTSGKAAEKREKELIKKQSTRKGPIYKIGNDPRVTSFGKFLRRWSIDELPQFWNVLKGEMSVVGPRPHQPREVEKYEKEHPQVFTLKPGITGLAQISGRSDLSFEEEIKLDILYIETWSLFLDLIIILKTPFVLFKKRKAL